MMFATGMGIGLMFWGVAEPLTHLNAPPMDLAEPALPRRPSSRWSTLTISVNGQRRARSPAALTAAGESDVPFARSV